MSGVIGSDGVQWERCNGCASWVRIQDLGWEHPTGRYRLGRDICMTCANKGDLNNVTPARSWMPQYADN